MKLDATPPQNLTLPPLCDVVIVGPCPLEDTLPSSYDLLMIVDGGMNHFSSKPEGALLIGDGDSTKTPHPFDWALPREKNFSDLTYALSLLPPNLKRVQLLGFTQGRFDHQLMVLGELFEFLGLQKNCQLELGPEIRGYSAGLHEFDHSGLFSVFSLKDLTLSLEGKIDYPARELELRPLSSHSLSNQSHGLVKVTSTQPFFVYLQSRA